MASKPSPAPEAPATSGLRVLVVDNYDSFTWNLVGQLRTLGAAVTVLRHDAPGLLAACARAEAVVVSPGPGRPAAAGHSPAVAERCLATGKPLLGVCLGHQLLAEVLGGRVVRAQRPMHGKTSALRHSGRELFAGWRRRATVMRYHSLVVSPARLPAALEVTALSATGPTDAPEGTGDVIDSGEIMAVRYRQGPAWGVQFHPESVLTPGGPRLLANWLALAAAQGKPQASLTALRGKMQ